MWEFVSEWQFNEDEINKITNGDEESDPLDLSNMKDGNEDVSSPFDEYICKNCNESFDTMMDYIKHVQTHEENHLYNCHLCDYGQTKRLSSIKSHLISNHKISKSLLTSSKKPPMAEETKKKKTGSPISLCEICSQVFDNVDLLNQHLESHPNQHTCGTCGEQVKLTLDFIKHCQQHTEDKLYRCTLCQYANKLICKVKSHLEASHPKFRKYCCQICGKKYFVLTQFKEHVLVHNGERPFHCKICSKTFTYSRYLNSHVKQEHVTGNFECEYCEMTFEFKGDHSRHLKQHRRKGKTYKCEVCGKELSGLDKLKIHNRIHTGDKPYNCSFCTKSFPSLTRLKEHENIHTKIKHHKCDLCEKSFSQRTTLTIHKRSVHTKEQPFICVDCGRRFAVKSLLNNHTKTCSTKQKNSSVKVPEKETSRKCMQEPTETVTIETHDYNERNAAEEKDFLAELPNAAQATRNDSIQEIVVKEQNSCKIAVEPLNQLDKTIPNHFQQFGAVENFSGNQSNNVHVLPNQQPIGQNVMGYYQWNGPNSTNIQNPYLFYNGVVYFITPQNNPPNGGMQN